MEKKSCILSLTLLASSNLLAQTALPVHLQADVTVTLPTGAGLAAIADGDFNHDGRRDLAVCERNLNQVALYMRSAAGTYPAPKYTYNVGQGPTGLVSFNRTPGQQYHADLMALSGPSGQWTMLRDDLDTTGLLVRRPLQGFFGTGDPSYRPVLVQANVDQNQVPDFVYTYPVVFNSFIKAEQYHSDFGSPTRIRQFDMPAVNTQANKSSNITLADFDLNGFLDPVVADSSVNVVLVVANFQTVFTYLQTPGRGPVHTAAADIDGDLLSDLVVAYAGSNEVTVFRTTTNFQFNRAYSYSLPSSPRRVLLADLNRDFYPELLVVTANNELRVYQHNRTGLSTSYTTFPPQVLATGVNPSLLQVAYLDNDNYPDIIVGCAGDNTIRTYLNKSGTVTSAQSSQALAEVSVYPSPATTQLTIQQPTTAPLTAVLLDEVGRPVRQQVLQGRLSTIMTDDLPRGIYMLRLAGKDGTHTTRVVLQ